jgi:hypothetical protein
MKNIPVRYRSGSQEQFLCIQRLDFNPWFLHQLESLVQDAGDQVIG